MPVADKTYIQSIQRASEILNIFLYEKKSIGIGEFSERLSLPKSTIQGIIRTLVKQNYLERDINSPKYRLGPMLFQLGMTYAANLNLINVVRVWMERCCLKLNMPVNTGILVGNRTLILSKSEPEGEYSFFPQAGKEIPAHTTCIGKILFAFLSKEHREDILKDYNFEALTKNSISSFVKFENELERIKKEGLAFDNEETATGIAGIGGPLFNYTNHAIAAFSVSGDAEQISEKRGKIIGEVRQTIQEVSALLGYNNNENNYYIGN